MPFKFFINYDSNHLMQEVAFCLKHVPCSTAFPQPIQ